MKIVCPDGTVEIREQMNPEWRKKLEALGDFIYGGFRPQVTYVTGDEEKPKE